ncbi:unnamed protein product [Amoebophrya sp. A120]|nr:unnamed protein product [Amoebophrya sp. A120]|eukprot:GSA120T00016281001.1
MTKGATFVVAATVGGFLPGVEGSGIDGVPFDPKKPFTVQFCDEHGKTAGTVATRTQDGAVVWVTETGMKSGKYTELNFQFEEGSFRWDEDTEKQEVEQHGHTYRVQDEPPRGCGKISVAGQRGCLGTNAADKNKLILGQECGDDQKSIRWCLSSSNLDWNTGTDDKGEYFVHDKAPFSIAESNHLASTLWTGWIPTWWSEYDYVTSEASRKGHKSVFLKQDGGEINVARLQPPQSGSSAAPEQALHGEEEPGHEAEDVGTGEAGHALAGGNIFQDDLHEEDNVAAAFEELVDENGEPAWLLAPQDVADVWSDEGGSGVSLADVNPEETHTKYWAFLAEEGFRACRGRVCPCRVLSLVEKHDSGGVPSWNFVWVSPSGSASAAPDEKWWVDRSILESDEPACEPQTPRVNLCKVELGQPAADVQGDVRDEGGLEREAAAGAAAAPEAAEVPEAEAEADETERAAEAEAEAAAASPEAEAAPPPPPDSGQVAAEEILQGIQRGEAFTMTFTTGSSGDKIVHRVGGGWSPWISALTPDEVSLVPEGTGASNQFRLVEPLPSGTGSLCGKLEAIGAAPGSGKHFVTCPTFGTSNGFKVQLTGQSRLASVVCFEFQEGHGWRVTKSDGGRRRMVVQGRVPAGAKQSQNVLWTDNKKVPTDEAHVQIDLLVNAEHDDDPEAAQARSDYDYYHPHGKDPLETDDEHYRMYDQGTVNEDQNQGSPREESAGQDEKLGPYDEVEAAKGAGVEQERLEEWLGTPSSPAEEIPGQVVFDEKQPFVLKWANPLTKKGAEDVVAHVTGGSKMQKAEALQTLTADKMNQVEQKVMELQFFEPQAVQDGKGVTEICGKMYVVSGFEPWTSKCIQKGGLAQPTKLFPWRSCSGSTGIARGVAQKFCLFEQSAAADDGKGARFRIHAFGKPAELLTTRQDFGRGYSNNYLHLDPQVQLNAPKDLILVQGNQRVKALSEVKGPSTTAAFASGGTTAGTAVLHEEAGSGAWARSEKNAPKPSLVDPEVRIADPEVLPLLKHLRAGEVFTIKIANEKEPQKPYTVYRVDDEDATAVFGAPKPPHSLGAAKEPLQERLELSGEDETLRVSPNFKLVNVATQHKNNFEACGDLQALGDVGDQAAAEQLFVYRASMGYATKPGFQAKLVNQEKIGGLPWVCLKLNAQQQEGSMSWELKLDGKSMILGGSIIFTVGRDVSVQDVRWSDQLNLVRPIQIDLVQPQAMLGSEIATGGGPPAAEVGLVDPAVKDPLDDLERKVRQGAYSFRIVFAQGSAASEEGAFKTAIFTSPDYVSMLAYDETSERPARKKLASDHRDFSLVDHIRSGPTPGSPLCGKVKATEPKDSGKCLGWQRKGPGLSEVDCRTLGLVFCFHAKPRASDDASQPRFTITHTASKTESFKLALPEGESPYVHLLPDGEITKSHATEVLLPATGEVLRQAEEKLKEAAEAKAAAATPQLPQ